MPVILNHHHHRIIANHNSYNSDEVLQNGLKAIPNYDDRCIDNTAHKIPSYILPLAAPGRPRAGQNRRNKKKP